jgi:predicted dithiol-disulfide oxidoreductase (DUF899 family)
MGWRFPWVSSLGSDFKYDFGAAFTGEQQRNGAEYNYRHVDQVEQQREGMSAFALNDGVVHHTYSTYEARARPALAGPMPSRAGCSRPRSARTATRAGKG